MIGVTEPTRPPRPFVLFRAPAPRRRWVKSLLRHIVIICLLFVILYPLLWMALASLHPGNSALNSLGLSLRHLTLGNYSTSLTGQLHFSRLFLNSLLVSVLEVAGALFSCSMAAYAFARLDFPFKRILFAVLIGALLLPYQVLIVPQFVIFKYLGLVGTYVPLILPHFLAVDAFFVFLNVQFMRTLPRELDDAAKVDGCGHLGVLLRVIIPMSYPALATTALFMFINSWNDLLGPLLYLSKPATYTVPLGLAQFLDTTGASQYGGLFAMTTLSLVPVVGFFFAGQRLLVNGIATTGMR